MLSETEGKILVGGAMDETENFVEPTLVKVQSATDALLRDEIFGPVLALVTQENLDEAIETVREICDTPLAVYIFSNDKHEQEKRKWNGQPKQQARRREQARDTRKLTRSYDFILTLRLVV